jgi:hypothetical protein
MIRARLAVLGVLVLCAVGAAASLTTAQVSRPASAAAGMAAQGRTTWFFYKVKWGFQDEFLDLFQRNHYPVLKARLDAGHYASIRTFTPTYHGDGRADWTFAVELVERADSKGVPAEEDVVKKLYPDQAKFRREERRRFELLEAHWDVPLTPVDFEARALSIR